MESIERHIPPEYVQLNVGKNNQDLESAIERLTKGKTYKDLSTIWITPSKDGNIKARVVSSWIALVRPMNQMLLGPVIIEGDEVGVAYQKAFDMVLSHDELSKWKYIFTVETDNLPPPDGLLKLYESMEQGYDCVGGLYWTKSAKDSEVYSQPMIYGNPYEFPRNFRPQVPVPETLMHCNGLGMGFNLWSIESLKVKLKDMPRPWFKTVQEVGKAFTQDLWFYNESAKYGWRNACDTRVKVGHLASDGVVW